MKKVLSFVLALVFVIGVCFSAPVTIKAKAASASDLTFELNQDGQSYCVSGYSTNPESELVIPDTYNDLPVTIIGDSAFSTCLDLTSITIPDSVTSIGDKAFYNCTSLTSVVIGAGVTTIGENAFSYCTSLEKVNIKDLVAWCNLDCRPTYIKETENALGDVIEEHYVSNPLFYAKNLYLNEQLVSELVIPEGVTKIGDYSFCYGSFNSVTIPESVRGMGVGAFYSCASLKNIKISEGITSIGEGAFCYCTSLESVIIPEGITSIGTSTFGYCTSLKSVKIPEGITSIGDTAFAFCDSLKKINIPDSVTSIGQYALGYSIKYVGNLAQVIKISGFTIYCSKDNAGYTYACDNGFSYVLADVAGSEDLNFTLNSDGLGYTLIGFKASSAYTNVSIPATYNGLPVTGIGENAFKNRTLLKDVLIPDSVTNIGNFAFYNCSSLASVTISDGVTSIGDSAFYNCRSLASVTISDSVTSIGDEAFYNCTSLKSITIPDSVTSIGDSTFYNCSSLASVTIPDSVISIEYAAFAGCTGLKNLTIGTGVKHVGAYAFEYCSNLNDVYIKEITNWCNIEFEDIKSNPLCYAKELYLNGQLITDLVIPGNVTEIKKLAFCGAPFNSVTINNGVTTIGMGAFYNSKSLTNATIPGSVTNINEAVFSNCTSLENVLIDEGVKTIGASAFADCSSLTSVTIPTSVTTIGENAFYGCTGLKKVIVKDLGAWCGIDYYDSSSNPLYYAKVLYLNDELVTDLVISEGITEIKKYAFYNLSTLESVTIPDSVTSIGEDAFAKCVQLKKVNISDVEKWCNITFASSTANPLSNSAGLYLNDKIIRNVILPETLTEVKAYTFNGNRFLKSVKLPDTIQRIGTEAFGNCLNLELLVMSKNVTDIGDSAFAGCKALESVVVPKSLKNVGYGAFHPNDGLKYVFYEGSVSDWNNIVMDEDSFTSRNLVIHYNSTDHTYMEVVNEPIFEGVEGTREEICSVCGHVGKEEKIVVINTYLAGVTKFDVALDAPTNYLVANISASKDLNESIVVMDGYTLTTTPNSDYGYYGTGSKVQVADSTGTQVAEYTLVVRGDVNGDSVCDVLDCMLIELARNNHKELNGIYFNAGDLTENGSIDVYDFEAVVNKAIA